ncbi:MAG: hypothetical protein AB7Q23_00885 [Hyphomonadaceae bacterium]
MLKTKRARAALALVGALWLTPAALHAQTSEDNTIVVTGRTAEATQRFVDQLAAAPSTAEQLARWDNTICTSVAGLPVRQGQFVADRIAQRAAALGLSPGAPGCRANISIIVTNDGNAAARNMHQREPNLFSVRYENNISTMGPEAFDDFLSNDRAVRWWHVAQTMGADGLNLDGDTSIGGLQNAPVSRSTGTRLGAATREDFSRAIIIIDSRRVGDVQLSALADYVAMVTLAQVNPRADTSSYPTILNLFEGGGRLTEMTEWDLAFLQSLYESNRSAANVQQQRNEIARRMQNG